MRSCCRFLAVVFLSVSALASELTVRVVDPQSAAVHAAQVEIFSENSTTAIAVQNTSPQGIAQFRNVATNVSRIHVLAPGFAEQWKAMADTGKDNTVTIQLHLAVATETVVVSGTRTPVPDDESGASIDTLSGALLETMRPVAASDALRFLPGAIVGTAGQRGGLGSLFVDGGESRYNKVIVDGVAINDPGGTFDFGTLPLFEADRMEFLRGAQSTLYGTDAMSSVVQVWSQTGSTPVPELRFGADAGNYGTENGYASLAGAMGDSTTTFSAISSIRAVRVRMMITRTHSRERTWARSSATRPAAIAHAARQQRKRGAERMGFQRSINSCLLTLISARGRIIFWHLPARGAHAQPRRLHHRGDPRQRGQSGRDVRRCRPNGPPGPDAR